MLSYVTSGRLILGICGQVTHVITYDLLLILLDEWEGQENKSYMSFMGI